MSLRSTFSPSLEQTYCCLRGAPSALCSMRNEIDPSVSEEEKSWTGTETSPKDTVAEAIGRAGIGRHLGVVIESIYATGDQSFPQPGYLQGETLVRAHARARR